MYVPLSAQFSETNPYVKTKTSHKYCRKEYCSYLCCVKIVINHDNVNLGYLIISLSLANVKL